MTPFVAFGSRAVSQLVAVVLTFVATHYLAPVDFGNFALAAVFITLARTLLYVGPYEYLLRSSRTASVEAECLTANVGLALASSVIIALMGAGSYGFIALRPFSLLMLWLAPSSMFSAVAAWQECQVLRSGKLKTYYAISTSSELLAGLAAAVAFALHLSVYALVVQNYARVIAQLAVYAFAARFEVRRLLDLRAATAIVRWSFARYASTIVSYISTYAADIVLGLGLSPAATGLFRAADRIATVASDIFSQPMAMMSLTQTAASAAAGRQDVAAPLRVFTGVSIFAWPALAALMVLNDLVVPLALGPNWTRASPLLAILTAGRLLGLATAPATALMIVLDHHRKLLTIQALSALATVTAALVVARWGVLACTMAVAAVGVGSTVSLLRVSRALTGVGLAEVGKAAALPLLLAVSCAAGVLVGRWGTAAWPGGAIARLALVCVCGGVGWLVCAALNFGRVQAAIQGMERRTA